MYSHCFAPLSTVCCGVAAFRHFFSSFVIPEVISDEENETHAEEGPGKNSEFDSFPASVCSSLFLLAILSPKDRLCLLIES